MWNLLQLHPIQYQISLSSLCFLSWALWPVSEWNLRYSTHLPDFVRRLFACSALPRRWYLSGDLQTFDRLEKWLFRHNKWLHLVHLQTKKEWKRKIAECMRFWPMWGSNMVLVRIKAKQFSVGQKMTDRFFLWGSIRFISINKEWKRMKSFPRIPHYIWDFYHINTG